MKRWCFALECLPKCKFTNSCIFSSLLSLIFSKRRHKTSNFCISPPLNTLKKSFSDCWVTTKERKGRKERKLSEASHGMRGCGKKGKQMSPPKKWKRNIPGNTFECNALTFASSSYNVGQQERRDETTAGNRGTKKMECSRLPTKTFPHRTYIEMKKLSENLQEKDLDGLFLFY